MSFPGALGADKSLMFEYKCYRDEPKFSCWGGGWRRCCGHCARRRHERGAWSVLALSWRRRGEAASEVCARWRWRSISSGMYAAIAFFGVGSVVSTAAGTVSGSRTSN